MSGNQQLPLAKTDSAEQELIPFDEHYLAVLRSRLEPGRSKVTLSCIAGEISIRRSSEETSAARGSEGDLHSIAETEIRKPSRTVAETVRNPWNT